MDKYILDLYTKAGEHGLYHMEKYNTLPAGQNGPHNHNMTSARNSGYFAILFAHLYTITSDVKWKNASMAAISELRRYRPLNGSYLHRIEDFKPSYNGLIGQAWTLEALTYCGEVLNIGEYKQEAQSLLEKHRFNFEQGLWHELDIAGATQSIGITLNQQIWFMAMSLNTKNDKEMLLNANRFLDKLGEHIMTSKNGLLYIGMKSIRKNFLLRSLENQISKSQSAKRKDKDVGYHVFTLVGLAIIYRYMKEHAFFQSKIFNKILNHTFSEEYFSSAKESEFSYGYNVLGFEVPFVLITFKDHFSTEFLTRAFQIVREMFEFQIENHFVQFENKLTIMNTTDKDTLIARFHEIYRIEDSFWREIL